MKKLLASLTLAGVAVFGIASIGTAGASTPTKSSMPKTWTPMADTIALSVIEGEAAFDAYAPQCVLDQIKAEFSSPRNFVKHAKGGNNDPRVMNIALDVVVHCTTS
jgi:hypothetical protein